MKTALVFIFFLSVLPAKALVEEPDHCVEKMLPTCLVKTQKKPELVRWGKTLVWLAKESMFELKGEGLRGLQGSAWVQSTTEIPFSTSYIQGTLNGDVWISHFPEKTLIRHLSGEIFIRHTGSREIMSLPVGFENWYGGLQTDGKAFAGTLRALPASPFLVEWFKEFKVPPELAKKIWQIWSQAWRGNVEAGSEIYQAAMDRQVAATRAQQQAHQRSQERQKQEAAALRQLYRSKNGLDAFRAPAQGPDSQEF